MRMAVLLEQASQAPKTQNKAGGTLRFVQMQSLACIWRFRTLGGPPSFGSAVSAPLETPGSTDYSTIIDMYFQPKKPHYTIPSCNCLVHQLLLDYVLQLLPVCNKGNLTFGEVSNTSKVNQEGTTMI